MGTTNTVRSFLLVRLSSLGDVVLSTHLPRLIRNRFPNSKIFVATSLNYSEVFAYNPYVDEVLLVDTSLSASESANIFREQVHPVFDVVVDLQNNIRSRALRKGLGKQYTTYPKHRLEKLLLVHAKKFPLRTTHVTQRYLSALEQFNVIDDGKGLELWLPNELSKQDYPPRAKSHSTFTKNVALVPGAKHPTKQWAKEQWVNLAEELYSLYQSGVVLVGGESEYALCKWIEQELSQKAIPVTNCANSTSIVSTAKNLDECSLVISNDSGVMHIAAARNIPQIAIFGSTVTHFGFAPVNKHSVVVENNVLSCRPCTHIGKASCPKGTMECLTSITPQQVLSAITQLENNKEK